MKHHNKAPQNNDNVQEEPPIQDYAPRYTAGGQRFVSLPVGAGYVDASGINIFANVREEPQPDIEAQD